MLTVLAGPEQSAVCCPILHRVKVHWEIDMRRSTRPPRLGGRACWAVLLICGLSAASVPSEVVAAVVTIQVAGAGTVIPTSPNGPSCIGALTTPSGAVGTTCVFMTPGTQLGLTRIVTLEAQAPPGWSFQRWRTPPVDMCATSPTCTIQIGTCNVGCTLSDRTVEADFVDVRPPDTAIDDGPLGTVVDEFGRATFSFRSPDDAGERPHFECRLDAGNFSACTSPTTLTGLADGLHHLEVRAIDPSGLMDATPAMRDWDEETPPDTRILAGPAEGTTSAAASFVFDATEPGSTFECQVDRGAFVACSSPSTPAGLTDGAHSFRIRATDRRGNTDPTPVARTWAVDTTPPDTSILSGPEDGSLTNSHSALFRVASEPGTRFECRLGPEPFAPCAEPYGLMAVSAIALGAQRFEARAVDAAGNADPSPAARSWTVTDDLDRDGFIQPGDCNDNEARVHPNAIDTPGDGIDQNCDGNDALFPRLGSSIGASWSFKPFRFTRLYVRRVAAGSTIKLHCQGRHCPFTRWRTRIGKERALVSVLGALRTGNLARGTSIVVRVSKPGFDGVTRRFVVRGAAKDPLITDRCLAAQTGKTIKC
jgi:hypothetical protein